MNRSPFWCLDIIEKAFFHSLCVWYFMYLPRFCSSFDQKEEDFREESNLAESKSLLLIVIENLANFCKNPLYRTDQCHLTVYLYMYNFIINTYHPEFFSKNFRL